MEIVSKNTITKEKGILDDSMKNREVVSKWIDCMLKGKINHKDIVGSKLFAKDNYLVSNTTPICEYKNSVFKCATKRYSVTTERHKYYLNLILSDIISNDPRISIQTVKEIPGHIFR